VGSGAPELGLVDGAARRLDSIESRGEEQLLGRANRRAQVEVLRLHPPERCHVALQRAALRRAPLDPIRHRGGGQLQQAIMRHRRRHAEQQPLRQAAPLVDRDGADAADDLVNKPAEAAEAQRRVVGDERGAHDRCLEGSDAHLHGIA
jgi:hypothetical protein